MLWYLQLYLRNNFSTAIFNALGNVTCLFSKQCLFKAVFGRAYFRKILIFEKVLIIARVRYMVLQEYSP